MPTDRRPQRREDRRRAKAAEQQFEDKWTEIFASKDELIKTLTDKKERTSDDEKALTEAQKGRADMTDNKAKEQLKLAKDWRALDSDARSAQTNSAMWGYWWEVLFVFGSIVLAMGLLVVSWIAQGAERWVALVMMAVITISLYIGGAAWMQPPSWYIRLLNGLDQHLVAGHANYADRRAAIEEIAAGKHVHRPFAETALAAGPQGRMGNAHIAHPNRILAGRRGRFLPFRLGIGRDQHQPVQQRQRIHPPREHHRRGHEDAARNHDHAQCSGQGLQLAGRFRNQKALAGHYQAHDDQGRAR